METKYRFLSAPKGSFFQQLASKENDQAKRTAQALKSSFARNRRRIGKITWTREDLYAR